MKYNISNFAGKPVLAEMLDPHKGRTMRAHYIGSDTLVGMHDGIDSWILQIGTAAFDMKLEQKMAAFLAGGEAPLIKPRRKVVEDDDGEIQVRPREVTRRRVYVS